MAGNNRMGSGNGGVGGGNSGGNASGSGPIGMNKPTTPPKPNYDQYITSGKTDGTNGKYNGDSLSGEAKNAYDNAYHEALGNVGVGSDSDHDKNMGIEGDKIQIDKPTEDQGQIDKENEEKRGELGKDVGLGDVQVSFQDALKKKGRKGDIEGKRLRDVLKSK